MYLEHYNLSMLPFENVPDPKFFFDQGDHSRIRKRIADSLKAGRGLTVVTGPMGSGKTTLSQMIISDFSQNIRMIWLAMPPENSSDLFLFFAQELGIEPKSSERTFILRDIRETLLERRSMGDNTLMIIDESHMMSSDIINGLRLLNNLEEGSIKLVQILLLGQEELLDLINKPENEHFKQRIATLESLGKLSPESIYKYINHRLQIAGGTPSIFEETGWKALVLAFGSGSTPRTINSLCDRTLTVGYQKGKKQLDVDDVYEAAEDMGLQKNVFFYKIELKKQQEQLAKELQDKIFPTDEQKLVAPEGARRPGQPPSPRPGNIRAGNVARMRRPEPVIRPEEAPQKTAGGDLKLPLAMLGISIVSFAVSFWFYLQRCDSGNVLTCFLDIFKL